MKHIFIVNPTAGKRSVAGDIKQELEKIDNLDWQLYVAPSAEDATAYVKQQCAAFPDEKLRFYACGGDGSICSTLKGVYGHDNASMTCYPVGSGNDYVRYYGGRDRFLDLPALLNAEEREIDLMSVNGALCINAFDVGFDAHVCDVMIRVRRKPIIGGNNAYYTGIVKALIGGMKTECEFYADGQRLDKGQILLATVANGSHVGGGFCCAPRSQNDDGLLEVCMVHPISRLNFLRLVGAYKKGKHLDDPRFAKHLEYRQAKCVEVKAKRPLPFVIDGDMIETDYVKVEIMPHALRFAVPK